MLARCLIAMALVAALSACGRRSLEQQFDRNPIAALPQGVAQVAYARVERLKTNPLITLAYERAGRIELGSELKGTSQALGLAGDVARLVIGTYGRSDKGPAVVALASGQFSSESFRKALASANIPHVESRYGSQQYWTCGRGDSRCHVSLPSPRLVVASSEEDMLKQTLDLARGSKKNLANDRNLAPLLKSFSADMDMWATGQFPRAFSLKFDEELRAAIMMIHSFTIKLTGNGETRLNAILHCASPESAKANAMIVQELVGSLATQLNAAGYQIRDLIKAIGNSQISVSGPTVDFQIEMNKAEIAATAKALSERPLRPMFAPSFSAPSAPEP
ncbi:hypothetical protein FJY63_11120 [Candidatus Sumerlaeota bacterium]|nr:hypothetical protein [Candidatus Sumerlaeota bacterium]